MSLESSNFILFYVIFVVFFDNEEKYVREMGDKGEEIKKSKWMITE